MKTLVIGTGGREHALALALSRDPQVTEVHAAPGNPGIAAVATLHDVDQLDGVAVASLAQSLGVDLVVVGPEAPLVAGVADAVRAVGIACFGPSAAAAQLEGSKAFAKQVMAAAEVPTAMAHVCDTAEQAEAALDAFGPPYVVKDDALAAGKGVVVTSDRQAAQDFKRALDGDEGPNTGGMGAYTPLDWAPDDLVAEVSRRVLVPTVQEMARRGTPFQGLLYAGLALTSRGTRVIEFNARFGDPETQALLAVLKTPLSALLNGAATGTLGEVGMPQWHKESAVTIVMAADGYPESPRKGDEIFGIEAADAIEGVDVIHAGTALIGGELVTSGGRVLSVTATGTTLAEARERAYAGVAEISFDGAHARTDIAQAAADGTIEA